MSKSPTFTGQQYFRTFLCPGKGGYCPTCSDALLERGNMVPCATIEDVVKSVAFEDDMGLRATASTETEDYDRLLTLELVKLRFDLI